MTPKEEILKLKDGEDWVWPEGDYGKALIKLRGAGCLYSLYEIPLYGGEPSLHDNYNISRIDDLIKTVESWT